MDDEPLEFTEEELQTALREVGEKARREAFAVGRPIMIVRDGQFVLLFADGTEQIVGSLHLGDSESEQ